MAETLANGTVVPVGSDLIHTSGVQAQRNMGASIDAQLGNRSLVGHTHSWDQVTGKPILFPPGPHRHGWADLDGVPAAFPPAAHSHPISGPTGVTGLQAALDAKLRKKPVNLGTEDLDTIVDDGTYSQASSSTASAALNYPANSNGLYTAGTLEVIARQGDFIIVQRFTTFNGLEMFWRGRYAGAWSAWSRVSSGSESATLKGRVDALAQDTGTRVLNADVPGRIGGDITLRRVGKTVFFSINELEATPNNGATTLTLPSSFIPSGFRFFPPTYLYFASFARSLSHNNGGTRVNRYGGVDIYNMDGLRANVSASWITDEAYPVTLPGTPA